MPIVDDIPQIQQNPNVFYSRTGFVLTPEGDSVRPYTRALNAIKIQFTDKGIGPWADKKVVFVTVKQSEHDRSNYGAPTSEVFCEVAADLIARGGHREATDEEILEFYNTQDRSKQVCDAMQAQLDASNGRSNGKSIDKLAEQLASFTEALANNSSRPGRKEKEN